MFDIFSVKRGVIFEIDIYFVRRSIVINIEIILNMIKIKDDFLSTLIFLNAAYKQSIIAGVIIIILGVLVNKKDVAKFSREEKDITKKIRYVISLKYLLELLNLIKWIITIQIIPINIPRIDEIILSLPDILKIRE